MATLMNLSKAASILDVSVRTIRRWIVEGKIRGVRLPGGMWRVYKEDIMNIVGSGLKSEKMDDEYDTVDDVSGVKR